MIAAFGKAATLRLNISSGRWSRHYTTLHYDYNTTHYTSPYGLPVPRSHLRRHRKRRRQCHRPRRRRNLLCDGIHTYPPLRNAHATLRDLTKPLGPRNAPIRDSNRSSGPRKPNPLFLRLEAAGKVESAPPWQSSDFGSFWTVGRLCDL